MFRFENIEYLWLLLIIALLFILFIINAFITRKAIKKFGDHHLVTRLIPDYSKGRKIIKFILVSLALALMIISLARPQFGTKLETGTTKGIEISVAIDVSNSMLAEDIKPNRLKNTLIFVQRILQKLKNDKISLIVFAGEAYVQLPITSDYNAARMFLRTINTDIVPVQGTAIGRAIELASRSFTSDENISKIILVITDGEDHEDNPVESAKNAANKGITVHTIGMGLPGGAPIPLGKGKSFLRDSDGNVVTTALDEKTLKEIAQAGNGIYVRASNNANTLDIILDELDSVKKAEISKNKYSEYEDQYQYFLALAIALLIINVFISERKNSLFKNINIFKINQ